MLPAELIEQYKEEGCLLLKGLFPPDRIAHVLSQAKMVFIMRMKQLGFLRSYHVSDDEFNASLFRFFDANLLEFMKCGKAVNHLASIYQLFLDQRVMEIVAQLGIELPSIGMRPLVVFHHPRVAKTETYWRLPLHQDWRTTQGSLDSITLWLPLVSVDKDLGALEIVPGSHLHGLLPGGCVDSDDYISPEVDPARIQSVEVEQGDALFFSAFLIHRSGTNVTDSIRWSCHYRFNNLLEKTYIERGYPYPFLYKTEQELITPNFPSTDQINEAISPPARAYSRRTDR